MPPELSPVSRDGVLEQLCRALRDTLGPRRYQSWFGGSSRLELSGGELVLHVASPYLVKWLQKQFEDHLLQIAAGIVGPDVRLRYEVGSQVQLAPAVDSLDAAPIPIPSHSRRTLPTSDATQATTPTSPNGQPADRPVRGRRLLSLRDFVTGEANLLAYTAVTKFLDDPQSVPSLYLHAGVGNGKTHLLEGIRLRLRKDHPGLQVVLISAEQFSNYFTQALAGKSLPSFRLRFRSVDVLLVDDVDFFDGKKGFQEEFLHTVKQFETHGRQVVFTSSKHPRMLHNLSEELVSRFLAGPVCRLESPDPALRLEIATRHAARQRARIAPEALELVASKFPHNVRELEGAVNLLATWSQMSGQMVSVTAARKLLGRLERDCVRQVQAGDVDVAVSEFFGLEAGTLRGTSRKQAVSQPRMLAMYLSRKLTNAPYSEIGRHFGGRNHSTVMSAERKIAELLAGGGTIQLAREELEVAEVLRTLEDRIKAG